MNRTKKGFTLIELLVVVGIIALLVAILVPAVQRAKEQANRSVCATRLKGIDTAAFLYSNTYKNKYPHGWVHGESNSEPGEWDPYLPDNLDITPQDSFALMVHKDYLPTKLLLCPTVGGNEAPDEWDLVNVGPISHPNMTHGAIEEYIHYAMQDLDAARSTTFTQGRGNYLAGPNVGGNAPFFADRGERDSPTNPFAAGKMYNDFASGNHTSSPGMQNVIGGAHGNEAAITELEDDLNRPDNYTYDETDKCMVGYYDGALYDNIYEDDDQTGDPDAGSTTNDTLLLSGSTNFPGTY